MAGDDDDFLDHVAREYVERHGPDAVSILRERADMADELGDRESAEAWRDIAETAESILREGE